MGLGSRTWTRACKLIQLNCLLNFFLAANSNYHCVIAYRHEQLPSVHIEDDMRMERNWLGIPGSAGKIRWLKTAGCLVCHDFSCFQDGGAVAPLMTPSAAALWGAEWSHPAAIAPPYYSPDAYTLTHRKTLGQHTLASTTFIRVIVLTSFTSTNVKLRILLRFDPHLNFTWAKTRYLSSLL